MANKGIKGITIQLGMESVGIEKALKDVNKQTFALQSELKQVERGLKFNPSSVELLAQKQEILTQSIQSTTQKLDQLKNAQQQVEAQFKSGDIGAEQYRAFRREVEKTENQLETMRSELGKVNDGSPLKDLAKDADKAEKSVGNLGEKLENVGGQVQSAGQGIATSFGAGTLAIGAGLGFAIKAAADNETQLAKMETAMKGNTEAAKEYLEWAKEFGKTTPFEASEVIDASIKLKSYGIEAKDTLESIGNMAAGMGKGLDDAIEAVADAQTGELERLKEFGITKQMLIDKALELGKGEIVNAKGQITDMAALNDALFAIMDERFKGGMERQSKTLNGQLSALKDSMTQTMAAIGEALMPMVEDLVAVVQKIADGFSNLSPAMQKTIAITAVVVTAILGLVTTFGIILAVVGGAAAGFGALSGAAAALGIGLLPLIGIVAGVMAAIAALVAIGVLLYKNWDEIKAKMVEVWGSTSEWFTTTLESIKTVFSNAWEGIKTYLSETWTSIKDSMTLAWESIVLTLTTIWSNLTTSLNQTWENIKSGAQTVWDSIVSVVIAIITPFIDGAMNLFNGMKSGIEQIFTGVQSFLTGFWFTIKTLFAGALLLLVDLVTGDFEALKNDSIAIWEKLKFYLEKMWSGLKDVFFGAISAIKGYFKAGWENIKTTTTTIFNGIKSLLSGIWDNIKSKISTTVSSIKSSVSTAWENLKTTTSNVWNGIKTTISNLWQSIKTTSTNAPEQIKNTVRDKFESLKTAVGEKMTATLNKIKEVWRSVKSFFEGIDLKSIGRDIIQGLINGISDKAQDLYKKARDIANTIKKTLKNVLDIHSPSRETEWMGEMLGAGFVKGMDRMRSTIANASDRMAAASMPTVEMPNMKGNLNTSSGNAPVITIPVYLDRYQIALATNQDISRLQGDQAASKMRFGGIKR
ncbi:MAG: phage tail tape measure protein [Bacillota bacterium]